MLQISLSFVLASAPAPAQVQAPQDAAPQTQTAQNERDESPASSAAAPSAVAAAEPLAMQRPAQDQPTPTPMPIDVNVSEVRVQGQTIPVYQPTHGMVLDEINTPNYKLTRREWNDTIKSDPELLQLHRRGRLMVPGLILSGIGVAILSFSVAVQLDVGAPESATGAYFAYAVPGALIATGLPLAIVGGKNRRMLNDRRARIMAAPTLSRHGGGIGVVARF